MSRIPDNLAPAIWAAALAVPAVLLAGAQTTTREEGDPARMQRLVKEASAVKKRHTSELFRLPAVTGAGIGLSKEAPKVPVIEVYVTRELTGQERKRFPKELEGVPVEIVHTGEFRALEGASDKKTSKRQSEERKDEPRRKN